MNKFFTKLVKIFLGLSMAAGVGVAISTIEKNPTEVGASNVSTLNFSAACGGSGTADDGSKWTITSDGTESSFDTTKGIHYGTNNAEVQYIRLSTSDISGTVSKVVVNASAASGVSASVSVTVGGSTFGTSSQSVSTTATDYTFEGSEEAGTIVVEVSKPSKAAKAIYCKSVVVTFDTGGESTGFEINISNFTKTGSGSGYAAYDGNRTIAGYGITSSDVMVQSNKIQFRSNSGWLKNTTSFGKIDKITLATATNLTIYVSSTEFASKPSSGTSPTSGSSISGTYGYFAIVGGSSTPATATITIDYTAGYTVDFNVQGHGTAPANQTIADGGKVTQPTAPTATGYTFGGWYKEAACTNAWNFNTDTVSAATTLYAKWTAKGSALTFNLNGGSGTAPTGKTATYGSAMPAYGQSAPTKTGYTFGGFYDGLGGTGTQYYTPALVSARTWDKDVTAGTTLYAKWIAKTSALTFNLNGGTGSAPTGKTATYGSAMPAYGQSAPTKTGYTFAGFYDGEGGTGTQYYTAALVSARTWDKDTTDGTTLYAKWTINSYTVTGTISNGELSSDDNVNYNEALSITIVPDTANEYTYPSSIESVTMGGDPYNGYEYDSTDGSFYIEHVTGDVEIVAHCVDTSATPYHVDYDLDNCSITNAPETIYSNEIKELQIVVDEHFKLPNSISVSGIDSSKWSYSNSDGTILISEPDGDMSIAVECVPKDKFDINLVMSNVSKSSGPSGTEAVEEGEKVTIVFAANANYGLPSSITVEMGEDTLTPGDDYTWTQGSGTLYLLELTDHLTVTISGVARDLTDGTLTLGSKKDAYTLGDDFELPATVVANFNIAPTTVDVKNDVEVSGPVTKNNDKYVVTGNGTVTLTYTYETTGTTQSASYAITVTPVETSSAEYRKVTSMSAGTYLMVYEEDGYAMSTTQGSNNRDSVSVTINNSKITSVPATAQVLTVSQATIENKTGWQFYTGSGYLYAASSSNNYLRTQTTNNADGLFTANFSGGDVTLTAQGSNTRNIIRFNTASNQLKFSCYASSSGLPVVQLYKYYPAVEPELKWITAELKTGTYYQGSTVNSSNFTVTAHYNGGNPQSEVVTENITVTNGYLANIGNNEVTLTYSGKSCKVNVTAVEQTAEYTGLTWTQGEYTIIDGQNVDFSEFGTVTAEYDDGEAYATKAISSCTVATYTKSGDVYTKVADLSDGTTITSSSHGKYLGVTYTETNAFTAYSSDPIYVVESINPVQSKVKTWTFADKATSIKVGDEVVIGAYYASGTTNYELAVENTDKDVFDGASYVTNPAGTIHFEVVAGSSSGTFAFKNGSNYLACSKVKSLTYSTDLDAYSSWTVAFDGTEATISNAHDSTWILQFNYNQGSTRFAAYASEQVKPFLVLGSEGYTPVGDNIANTNALVQKAVLVFAEHFNDTMQCVNGGTTVNVASKWSSLSSDFSTALSGFTGDDLTHFKALFAKASSVEDGDTLQDMLARYDYIVAKYKLSDFLNSATDRPEVAQSTNVSPLINIIGENTNTVAIIVIISMVSVTAIGGYFFLTKRKENN